ncbi:MAG TPA: hypothetical protein VGI22_15410 [Xanthobacteraceae bacterium]|jgi:hypothetical protein
MHRTFSVLFSFDAPYATALCVALATIASNVALPEGLPVAGFGPEVASAADQVVSAPTSAEDNAQARADDHASQEADVIVVRPDPSSGLDLPWAATPEDQAPSDRDYLIETAVPGSTMVRQGPELAIGRLHPEFVHRLAGAIREARESGLASAGIFSAYRPPAFGVGGFSDKFNSLHTYGLAVDMSGIGGPGSADAKLWYEIAAKHGVVCPYGFESRLEWNHCQPTRVKIILPASPLRETVTANGPIDLESMFQAGNSFIANAAGANEPLALETPDKHSNERMARAENRNAPWNPGLLKEELSLRAERRRPARAETSSAQAPSGCGHPHRGRKDACGTSRVSETGSTRNAHRRQASAGAPPETQSL